MRTVGAVIAVALLIAGCGSLRGVPPALSDATRGDLASDELSQALVGAEKVIKSYVEERDRNLEYVYWSNAAFVPLAAASAGGLYYKAHNDFLAGIGIIAGSLAGFNSFTNARANARVYQQGINALECAYQRLSPYKTRNDDAVTREADNLEDAIDAAKATLAFAEAMTFKSPEEKAEIEKNGSVVSKLAVQMKRLSTAIGDADKQVEDARAEAGLFSELGTFAGASVRRVHAIVSGKIAVLDTDFASLKSSIGANTPQKAAPKAGAATAAAPAPAVQSATPIADVVADLERTARNVEKLAQGVAKRVQKFALSANKKAVDDCISTAFPT